MRAQSFDEHYRTAWALVKRVMLTGTNSPDRRSVGGEAEQAVAHFRECLALDPRSWACLWGMGKAEQAMGNHREALVCFERAAQLEIGNVDVWREAAIAACALGDAQKAVQHVGTALKLKPHDAGLHSNAAIAFLLVGDDDEAERLASRACKLDPNDAVNRGTAELVSAVRRGVRERPRAL